MSPELHIAVALDGAGSHPDAWRAPGARPAELFTPAYWLSLVREAERGRLDFVTIEDSYNITGHAGRVQGRLEALLIAARIAPVTKGIGIVPAVAVAATEPFHVSTQVATLDYLSRGRAGWQVLPGEALDEAADHVEVVRRLWDSWEDDAVIRDVGTGRFIDRDKLHYVDFTGRHFSVRGPSITPRPPQGQPLVATVASGPVAAADVVFVDSPASAAAVRADAPAAKIFVDVAVSSDDGPPQRLADRLLDWRDAGVDGFRLHPGVLAADLTAIVDGLLPILRERGAFRREYTATTLRGHLGLHRPANRYAKATA
ncbi:LLM class flavin-dependent oxidoreductase [Dactylosporangium sp. CA-139066]|uniref:LLM class flavin-dependent oxidoreductase n=1 Tax=Dactylosporangium sp. CA-139066 TaxID=3239930 RepID=UPI003D94EBA8